MFLQLAESAGGNVRRESGQDPGTGLNEEDAGAGGIDGDRLVVDAAQHAAKHHGADRFVIVADEHYHALGLYESLGFVRAERVLRRLPPAAQA